MTRITIRIGSITGQTDSARVDRAALEQALHQAAQSGRFNDAAPSQHRNVSTTLGKGGVSTQVAAAVVKAVKP